MSDDYERIGPGHVDYERLQACKAKGLWMCDSVDHNEGEYCSNPGCFKSATPDQFERDIERDIAEYGQPNEIDTFYIRRKLQLAGEMKTAIKRFLSDWEKWQAEDQSAGHRRAQVTRRVRVLKAVMEDYLNCEEARQREWKDAFHALITGVSEDVVP